MIFCYIYLDPCQANFSGLGRVASSGIGTGILFRDLRTADYSGKTFARDLEALHGGL